MDSNTIRVIVESSSKEGIEFMLQSLEQSFAHVSATIPARTHDGRFISSVYLSTHRPTLGVVHVDRL